jgi:hypothetical protein
VVAPARSEGGYRLYDDAAIARLTAMLSLPVFLGGRHQDDVGAGERLGHSLRDAATAVLRRLARS